jgi:hypothetical protein
MTPSEEPFSGGQGGEHMTTVRPFDDRRPGAEGVPLIMHQLVTTEQMRDTGGNPFFHTLSLIMQNALPGCIIC